MSVPKTNKQNSNKAQSTNDTEYCFKNIKLDVMVSILNRIQSDIPWTSS